MVQLAREVVRLARGKGQQKGRREKEELVGHEKGLKGTRRRVWRTRRWTRGRIRGIREHGEGLELMISELRNIES